MCIASREQKAKNSSIMQVEKTSFTGDDCNCTATHFLRFYVIFKDAEALASARVVFFLLPTKRKTFLRFLNWKWKSDDLSGKGSYLFNWQRFDRLSARLATCGLAQTAPNFTCKCFYISCLVNSRCVTLVFDCGREIGVPLTTNCLLFILIFSNSRFRLREFPTGWEKRWWRFWSSHLQLSSLLFHGWMFSLLIL